MTVLDDALVRAPVADRYHVRPGRTRRHRLLRGVDSEVTTYGYRLFSAELMKQTGRTEQEFSDCSGEHFVDVAERLLEELRETMIGKPKLRDTVPEEPAGDETAGVNAAGERAFQVTDLGRTASIIRGTVFAGTVGHHKRALGVPGLSVDVDLSNSAASQEYRFVMAFPDKGTRGIVGMETIGRSCPVGLLRDWLAKTSQLEVARKNAAAQEKDGKDAPALPWWKLRLKQLTDEEHLQSLIDAGKLGKIELSKFQVLPDRKRDEEKFRLTSPRVEGNVAQEVGTVLIDWFSRVRGGEGEETSTMVAEEGEAPTVLTEKDGARQLATILGPEVAALDFDDGWIMMRDEGGDKKVSPNRMPEVFTYFVDWSPPSDIELYRRIRDTSTRLKHSAEVDVNWPAIESEE